MDVTLNKDQIASVMKRAVAASARNANLPILSCLLVRGEGTRLSFIGSDLQSQITVTTAVQELAQPLAIAINAKKLSDIVNSISGDTPIVLSIKDGKAMIRAGKSRFTLQTIAAQDFPMMEVKEDATTVQFDIQQGLLRSMLSRVEHAAATNDVRYYLNGVFLNTANGSLYCVATNGHRLALTSAEIEMDAPISMILPAKTVSELIKSLTDSMEQTVGITITGSMATFKLGNMEIVTKLIDGRYPDWQRVLPQSADAIHLPVSETKDALARAKIMLDDKMRGARIEFSENVMRIEAKNTSSEEGGEEMEVQMEGQGFSGGWNVDYLIDALNATGVKEVTVSQRNSDGPMLFEAPAANNFRAVVMAMRL